MNINIWRDVASAVLAVVLAGCSAGERGEAEAGPSEVLMSVGAHVLTEADVLAREAHVKALFAHRAGKADPVQMQRIGQVFRRGLPVRWVEDRVLADRAAAEGFEVPAETLKAFEARAFRNFKVKGDGSLGDLAKVDGVREDLLREQVRAEALREAIARHWAELEPTNLPPDYVATVEASVREHNARMALTNAWVFARATNVWQEIVAGGDFTEIGRKYTELPEEQADDCEWAVVDEKFLSDDPELLAQLKKMQPGEVSPPVRGDNGLMIARLDGFEPEGGYAVSRIFLHLPQFYTVAPSNEIVSTALTSHREGLFARRLAELVRAASVSTNGFDNWVKKQQKKGE